MTPDDSKIKTPPASAPTGPVAPHCPLQVPDHELIRPIGHGSFGEVWLARNVMGTYRAVKIVHRSRFETDRPYEREFSGIQRFEPISRGHEGLVDLLQVGRPERAGYFYCVMELADDERTGQTISPETYHPKTLRSEITRRGRLPFAECVRLGISLADGLSHLHERGLIHRDIKPSNIIFVNGQTKLADIGLVADVGDAKSLAGTEGFIPPEGPGSTQADIYSLGKVLYEIATGKDRQAFPEPPTFQVEANAPEQQQFLELNEIILKACEKDVRKRYQSAEAMRADLVLLQSGHSVKRLHVVERRFALARSIGAVAIAVALLAIVAVLFFARQARRELEIRNRMEEALTRAGKAEQSARQESYARAMLLAYEGVQANNFGLVRELLDQTRAFAMEEGASNSVPKPATRSISQPQQRHVRREARDESAFVLARCDSSVEALTVSPDGQWLAAGQQNGQVQLWDLSNCELHQAWQLSSAEVTCLVFSSDNRLLAVGGIDGWVRTLLVPSGEVIAEYREESRILDIRFSKNGNLLLDCSTHGLGLHDFATGANSPKIGNLGALSASIGPDLKLLTVTQPHLFVWFWLDLQTNLVFPRVFATAQEISPDGRWLAVGTGDPSIDLWSLAEKRQVRQLTNAHTASAQAIAWSGHCRLLASGGFDNTVAVWDPEHGTLLRQMRGHQDKINSVVFSPDSRTLYSASADRTIRAWTDWNSSSTPENETSGFVDSRPEYDQPTAAVAEQADKARSALPWEWRRLQYECRDEAASVVARCAGSVGSVAVSPDGRWLAVGVDNGKVLLCELLDAQSRTELRVSKSDVDCLAFSPESKRLAAGCMDGSVRVVAIPSGAFIAEFQEADGMIDLCFSLDGQRLAYCSSTRFSTYDFLTANHWHGPNSYMDRVAVASDLKLITRTLRSHGLAWWCGNTNVIFPDVVGNRFADHGQAISPDERWLAVALADYSIELWSVAEKRPMRRLTGHTAAVRALAWSPDSRFLGSGGYDQTITIWDTERGTALRRLHGHRDFIAAVAFSNDGQTLFSGSYDKTVRAWTNLQAVSSGETIALPAHAAYGCLGPGRGFAWGVAGPDNAFWAIKMQPTPAPYGRLDRGHATHFAISPDGQRLVTGYPAFEMYRYQNRGFVPHAGHRMVVPIEKPPAFSHDGSRVAMAGINGALVVWQLEPWRELQRWEGLEGYAEAILFDSEGNRVFVRCQQFGVFAGSVDSGRLVRMPKARKSNCSGMDLSFDNRFLAVSSFDGTVDLWACDPREEPKSLGQLFAERTDAWSIAFSPDGQRLAVGLADGNIHIWDIKHRMLVGVLKGHRQPVWELGFNPEDDSLVSLSPDELRVWRVADGK